MPNPVPFIAALALLSVPTSAVAQILIDDFTQTSDPSLYDNTSGFSFLAIDPILDANGGPLVRLVQTVNPFFGESTAVSLDTNAGSLRFENNGAVSDPIYNLTYFGPSSEVTGLDLDVSGETALRLRYQTSAPVSVEIRLSGGRTDGALTQGNTAFVELVPGGGVIDVPLSVITGDAVGTFGATPGTGAGRGDLLDDFDPRDLDQLSFVFEDIGPVPVPTTPGLDFVFEEIAFVPEPATAALFAVAGAALCGRRRGSARRGA